MVDWLFLHQHAGMLVQFLNDTSDSLVIVLDDDARIVDANRAFLRLTGQEKRGEKTQLNDYLVESSRLNMDQLIEWSSGPQLFSFRDASENIRIFSCWILPIPMGFLLIGEKQSAADEELLNQMSRQTTEISNLMRELKRKNEDLLRTRNEIHELKKFLPICANCKKVRKEDGEWEFLEQYLHHQTGTSVSHGICPDCRRELYPGLNDESGED